MPQAAQAPAQPESSEARAAAEPPESGADAGPGQALRASRETLHEATIVLVDDDEATINVLKKMIGALYPDAEIEAAFDPAGGLSKAAWHSPALIILDHMMPNMDGKEFLRALRSHPCGKEIPVLAHSALSLGPVYEDEALVEFLKKPATPDTLEQAIARLWARLAGDKA